MRTKVLPRDAQRLELARYFVRTTPAGEVYTVTERLDEPENADPISEIGWAIYVVTEGIRDWVWDYDSRDEAINAACGMIGCEFKVVRDAIEETREQNWIVVERGGK